MAYLDNTGVGTLWNRIKTYIAGLGFYTKPTTGIPATDIASGVIPTVPTNVSSFTNDAGYITGYTETDPTVPAWAKQSTKPSYTASEVGALPDTTVIPTVPTALSAFTDDLGSNPTHTHSQYLTSAPVTSVNGQTGAVSLTIPSAVTEFTVTGWGFTKNGGTVTSTGGTTAVNNIQVVSELPASPDANTLYLIPES